MSETLYMRISTQNIACSQRQINTCHTSFSYILWAYGEHIMNKWSSRTSDQFIWLGLEKKTEAVKAYLIKNSKGEAGEKKTKKQKHSKLIKNRERERERERPTDRPTDRQTSLLQVTPTQSKTTNDSQLPRQKQKHGHNGQIIVYIYFVIVTMFLWAVNCE